MAVRARSAKYSNELEFAFPCACRSSAVSFWLAGDVRLRPRGVVWHGDAASKNRGATDGAIPKGAKRRTRTML